MKIFFVAFLVVNLIFEGLAGVGLILGEQGVMAATHTTDSMWGMNYGFGAFAIASAVFWLWPNRSDAKAVGSVLGILLTFHTLLCISLAIAGNQIPGMVIHGIMAVLSLVLLTQRSKWCGETVS